MALVLIPGPGNAPSTAADWDKINKVLQTIGLDINSPARISGSKILRGSVIFFAGAWYVATSDTAITGSATKYVRLTNNAGTITAAFVSSLSGVTFNRTWNGWYDSSLRLYLFDEVAAYAAGQISELATMREWRPTTNWAKALTSDLSNNWVKALGRDLLNNWEKALTSDLSNNWVKALGRDLSNEMLVKLFSMGTPVTLTDSGTWTVPAGVYYINVLVRGPGTDGTAGGPNNGGSGGNAGQVITKSLSVVPGQTITYSVGATTTVFGSLTATKGTGEEGGAPYAISYLGQLTYAGGNGGGGVLGSYPGRRNAQNAPANSGFGGGGGAGGSHTNSLMRAAGSGARGKIVIS